MKNEAVTMLGEGQRSARLTVRLWTDPDTMARDRARLADPACQWFIAQTARFALACHQLRERRLTVWSPTCLEPPRRVPRNGRLVRVAPRPGPMFPGYLFLCFDARATEWQAINLETEARLLLIEGTASPRPVPRRLIDELRLRSEVDGGHINLVPPPSIYLAGQPMTITAGPLAGLTGLFVERVADRIKILLTFLGESRETEISDLCVAPAT